MFVHECSRARARVCVWAWGGGGVPGCGCARECFLWLAFDASSTKKIVIIVQNKYVGKRNIQRKGGQEKVSPLPTWSWNAFTRSWLTFLYLSAWTLRSSRICYFSEIFGDSPFIVQNNISAISRALFCDKWKTAFIRNSHLNILIPSFPGRLDCSVRTRVWWPIVAVDNSR